MAEEGAAAPNPRQGQDHEAGQRHLHIIWPNFKPEFSGKPDKMQKHIYSVQTIG